MSFNNNKEVKSSREHNNSNVYGPSSMCLSPHTTKNSPNTIWVSIPTLPASDPTGWGLSSRRLALPPTHFRCQSQVQVVICASDQTATALQIGGSDTPFPGSINLLECSQSSEKHFTSHVARLLQKDLVEECTGQGMRRGHKILFPCLHMFTNPEALQTQSFWRFMEASLHGSDWLSHCPLRTDLSLQLLFHSCKSERGWDWKFPLPNYRAGSMATSPHLQGLSKSHLLNVTKDTLILLKHRKSPGPRKEPKAKYKYFLKL